MPSTLTHRDLFLGIDVGTQGTKAMLVEVDARAVRGRGSSSYGLIEGLGPGCAEQHPGTWHGAVQAAVAAALEDAGARPDEVRGIGVSGQQHGAVLLDETYGPIRAAKLWCDTSTAAQAEALTAALGRPIPAGFTAPKLRYTADEEPELWERTRHVLLPHDFVNACLAHDLFTEVGDASGTGYLDVDRGTWDADAMEATAPALAERVPRIVPVGGVAAEVVPSSAEWLGLAAGTPVSAGGGDNMLSAIGAGATRPGAVVCSLGTSGTVFAYADARVPDPTGGIAAFRASSALGIGAPAGHLPLACVMNCTAVLEEVVALTGRSHAELTALAAAAPPGSGGARFIGLLAGERVPNRPDARGSITGLRSGSLRPDVLYRAALEGIAAHLGFALGLLRDGGVRADEVRLVGGAARNPLLRTLLGSAFGCPVTTLREAETAALGGALQAAAAVRGVPADDVVQAFDNRGTERSEPDTALAGLFEELIAGYAAL
ncbi:MAG: xylulokinase [Planctomycetota bacterium]